MPMSERAAASIGPKFEPINVTEVPPCVLSDAPLGRTLSIVMSFTSSTSTVSVPLEKRPARSTAEMFTE